MRRFNIKTIQVYYFNNKNVLFYLLSHTIQLQERKHKQQTNKNNINISIKYKKLLKFIYRRYKHIRDSYINIYFFMFFFPEIIINNLNSSNDYLKRYFTINNKTTDGGKIETNKIKIINETIPNFVPMNKNSLTEKL